MVWRIKNVVLNISLKYISVLALRTEVSKMFHQNEDEYVNDFLNTLQDRLI
jgi:hypothetical protein